jgi:hypothetical protein
MNVITKDILTVEQGIICHQVNAKGVAGAGLAKDLFALYPRVGQMYRRHTPSLGEIGMWAVNLELWICNLVGQASYGRRRRHTNYDAVEKGLSALKRAINSHHGSRLWSELPLYFPYQMGCGLGGGDWEIVQSLIESCFPGAVICRWP